MIIQCDKCRRVFRSTPSQPFKGCDCGATLTDSLLEYIHSVDYELQEISTEIRKRSSESVCDSFTILGI